MVKELNGYGLDRTMSQAGWTCFYSATEIGASAVALSGEKSVSKAVNQILTKQKLERFNSLEITQVTRIGSWDYPTRLSPLIRVIFRKVCFCSTG